MMNSAEIKAALDNLNAWLQEHEKGKLVSFDGPVSEEDIAAAEAKLGVKLPPSYVDFVTTYGTFELSGELTGRGLSNDTELFGPAAIVGETQHYREELNDSPDEESAKIVDDGILFCADPLDEFFHLFVISTADAKGEMRTRSYNYQDPACSDGWNEGDGDFGSVVQEIIDTVMREAL